LLGFMTPVPRRHNQLGGLAVQHVGEAAVQPRFTSHVVALTIHRFREYVSIVTLKPRYLLLEAGLDAMHHILVALVPQFVAMNERTGDPPARYFNDLFAYRFSVVRRQLAVPIYDPSC